MMIKYLKVKAPNLDSEQVVLQRPLTPIKLLSFDEKINDIISILKSQNVELGFELSKENLIKNMLVAYTEDFLRCLTGDVYIPIDIG